MGNRGHFRYAVRHQFLLCLLLIVTAPLYGQGEGDGTGSASDQRPTYPFDRQWLEQRARELSQEEFQPQELDPDHPLTELSYDQYRAIEFQRGASIWNREDRNFRVGLLHPGFLFKTPVKLNLVSGGVSRGIFYTTDIFNYGNDSDVVKDTEAPGYSGFRVNTPINKPGKWDEFLVFQGGSYFRALGQHNWYGLSARGLAINTAKPTGEEFPTFTEFWIERPAKHANRIVIHALLESPSVTGAYTFTATPGENTVVEVDSVLYPREELEYFGIAPLTSMFMFDATNRSRFDDFRPAVHDSNGLFMALENGEQIWRPLANPVNLQVSSFMDASPRGFGLLQRSREFDDFEDVEARYQLRPSVWVEPVEGWGAGSVELVEIPSSKEANDNIVAFWRPEQPMEPGRAYRFRHRIYWGMNTPAENHPGRVVASRSGLAVMESKVREFNVDFAAEVIPDDLQPHVETSQGKIIDSRGMRLESNGHYRVTFKFDPEGEDLAEFRLWLTSQDKPWGETWLYRWTR